MFSIIFCLFLIIVVPLIVLKLVLFKDTASVKNVILFMLSFIKLKLRELVANLFENGLIIKNEDTMTVIYYLNNVQYQICTPIKRGIRDIKGFDRKQFEKNTNQDDLFNRSLGPFKNFHGISTTPRMIGFNDETLIIHYRDGIKKECGPDEIISITI